MLASIAKLLPHPIKTFVKTAEKPNGRSEFHFLLFALEVLTSKKIAQLEKEKGEVRVFHHPKKMGSISGNCRQYISCPYLSQT